MNKRLHELDRDTPRFDIDAALQRRRNATAADIAKTVIAQVGEMVRKPSRIVRKVAHGHPVPGGKPDDVVPGYVDLGDVK